MSPSPQTPPPNDSKEFASTETSLEEEPIYPPSIWSRVYAVITYTPARCRYDLEKKPKFGLPLNLLFGLAGTVTVANLYYNHPILKTLAQEFGVDEERVSLIPTLMQAGYATGLLFLAPLGDLFRRRAFVLILIGITATLWYESSNAARQPASIPYPAAPCLNSIGLDYA